MPKIIDVPDFQDEEDEANWWDGNQERLLESFKEAERDGTLLRGRPATDESILRVGPEDVRMAKEQAAKLGVESRTYLLGLLHQALLKQASLTSR